MFKLHLIIATSLFSSISFGGSKAGEFSRELDRIRTLKSGVQFNASSTSTGANSVGGNEKLFTTSGSRSNSGESLLYQKIVEHYEAGEMVQFKGRATQYLISFPKGIYADDSLYLLGLVSVAENKFGPALEYFNRVVREFPNSNRLASAHFGRGVAYKKMHFVEQSQQIFSNVIKEFPGSPEAFRAENELKLIAFELTDLPDKVQAVQ